MYGIAVRTCLEEFGSGLHVLAEPQVSGQRLARIRGEENYRSLKRVHGPLQTERNGFKGGVYFGRGERGRKVRRM